MYAISRSLLILIVTYTSSSTSSRPGAILHGQAKPNEARITQIVPISPKRRESHDKRMRISLENSEDLQEEPPVDSSLADTGSRNQTSSTPKEKYEDFSISSTDDSNSTDSKTSPPDIPNPELTPLASGTTSSSRLRSAPKDSVRFSIFVPYLCTASVVPLLVCVVLSLA